MSKKFATDLHAFANYQLKRKEHHIQELDLWVYLQELPAAHADIYNRMKEFTPEVAKDFLKVAVVNEAGEPIFAGKEGAAVLDRMSWKLINDIFTSALSIGSLNEEVVAEEKKGLAATA